jgi:hypothetical protein
MTELERIKNIEEKITLARLLPGMNLAWLRPEDAAKLKRAALDLYRLGHARGFKAGVDYAVAGAILARRDAVKMGWLNRWLSARMRERWLEFKKSLRSIRVSVILGQRRFPTEALSDDWAIRR